MRRAFTVLAAIGILGMLAGPALAVGRPELSIVRFHRSPFPGPEGEREWILTVEARDVDGVIWEVEVDWGDRGITWATTYCVQGTEVGRKATVKIGHHYAKAGTYRVRARALSIPACDAGFDDHQVSPWTSMNVSPRA